MESPRPDGPEPRSRKPCVVRDDWQSLDDERLLDLRVCELGLQIEGSALEATIDEIQPQAAAVAEVAPAAEPVVVAQEAAPQTVSAFGYVKNVALFLAAPLIGLVYALLFPVMGLGLLAWHGAGALARRAPRATRIVKRTGLFISAPFVGLAYAIALPLVGLGMLVLLCAKPLFSRVDRS